MTNRAAATHPYHAATFSRVATAALAGILFAAVLLFAFFVTLRYAHGWAEVVSEGAAVAVPMASDGLVVVISALVTAGGTVLFYVRKLAR
jgi:orotate phosphoribosyltransferase